MMTSASGTIQGWSVEARCVSNEPRQVGGIILDKEWRGIAHAESKSGIPRGNKFDLPWLAATNLLSYEAAQSLRWWFTALAQKEFLFGLCLETRLVAHNITYCLDTARVTEGWEITEDTRREVRAVVTEADKQEPPDA